MASDFADDLGRRTHDARDALLRPCSSRPPIGSATPVRRFLRDRIAGVDSLRQGRDAAGNLISAGVDSLRQGRDAAGNAISEGVNNLMGKRDTVGNALSAGADNLKYQAGCRKRFTIRRRGKRIRGVIRRLLGWRIHCIGGLTGLKTQAADALNSATGLAQDYAGRAASTFRDAAGGAADTASRARAQAADLTQRAGTTFVDTIQKNPLAVAGIGLRSAR